MDAHFHLEAQLRQLAGHNRVTLELPAGSTLLHGLQALAERFPAVREYVLSSAEAARPSLVIVVDNAPVHARQAGTVVLQQGSTVVLLPPISGG